MNKELIQSISEIFIGLRPLIFSRLIKPLKDSEKCSYPHGYINVMHCIKANGGEPVSMTDLAMAASIAKPNLTTIVDRLTEEGLVERSTDLSDRRIVNIVLTKEGIDFLSLQKQQFKGLIEERMSNLDDKDLIKLKRALEDIREVIKKLEVKKE